MRTFLKREISVTGSGVEDKSPKRKVMMLFAENDTSILRACA
jgi:hypothetical protein